MLGALRLELGRRFGLIPEGRHDILWVVEFPMFMWHPRSSAGTPSTIRSPRPSGDLDDPANLLSRSYDLVLDGNEIGGGSIRIHRRDVQQRVFELIGIEP